MNKESKPIPLKNSEQIQLSIAKIALEIAKITTMLEMLTYQGSKATSSMEELRKKIEDSHKSMMELAGNLLGEEL